MKYLTIDFEYNSSQNSRLNVVCASMNLLKFNKDKKLKQVYRSDLWLYGTTGRALQDELDFIQNKQGEFTVLPWNAIAEGRSFSSCGVNPRDYKWIDLNAEYRMLLNHWHKYMYGEQMIDGVKKVTIPPAQKYAMSEQDQKKANADKPQNNLVAAVYNLLGEEINSEYKDQMRDMIISNNSDIIVQNKKEIIKYCRSDIKYLGALFERILELWKTVNKSLGTNITTEEMLWRGRSVVNASVIESNGYPINSEWANNFTDNVPYILREVQEDIDSQFTKEESPFAMDPLTKGRGDNKIEIIYPLVMPRKRITHWKDWIKRNAQTRKWLKTGKGGLSTSLDAWTRYFRTDSHSFKRGNFAHQVIRYLKFNQQLNGFQPAKKGKSRFVDYIGEDGRVRGYLNPYGSQTARFQPKAVSFLFLKSAWMRAMCQPQPGKYVCGIDYSQQEFLINALKSKDENMINAYESGDVYLHTAKLAGAVPKNGKKKDYPKERATYKQVTLAINYLMSCYGLSDALTQSLGKPVDEDQAQSFIDEFYEVYSASKEFMDEQIIEKYETQRFMKLEDGWILFGDNSNFRSYGNFPIQGAGSCILRKAIDIALNHDFKLVFPLHDALYFEGDIETMEEDIFKFDEIMKNAFASIFPDKKRAYNLIRTDVNIWGPDLKNEEMNIRGIKVKSQDIYVDERGASEYERFKKHMTGTVETMAMP